jgi:hypothetical protein
MTSGVVARKPFCEVCPRDRESLDPKFSRGDYEADGSSTSWLTIKHVDYSRLPDRRGGRTSLGFSGQVAA